MDEGMNKELRSNKTKLLYTYFCLYFIIIGANISGQKLKTTKLQTSNIYNKIL